MKPYENINPYSKIYAVGSERYQPRVARFSSRLCHFCSAGRQAGIHASFLAKMAPGNKQSEAPKPGWAKSAVLTRTSLSRQVALEHLPSLIKHPPDTSVVRWPPCPRTHPPLGDTADCAAYRPCLHGHIHWWPRCHITLPLSCQLRDDKCKSARSWRRRVDGTAIRPITADCGSFRCRAQSNHDYSVPG